LFGTESPAFPALLHSSQVLHLSDYEKSEMVDVHKVYYAGTRHKIQARPDLIANNFGYDDVHGDYIVITGDHLAYRYEIVDVLGKSSFGQVLRCRDHATGESVAVKIARNKKSLHNQALTEAKILEDLKRWVCGAEPFYHCCEIHWHAQDPHDKHQIIRMHEYFNFRGHLCIALELLSMNLFQLMNVNQFVGFSIRGFAKQMLNSLVLMEHHRVIHRDLKPEVCCLPLWFHASLIGKSHRMFFCAILLRAVSRSLISAAVALNTTKVNKCWLFAS
jgi:dual specificity tyrosine-phosphorylation-regulated kinase 2/3/4